LPNVANYEARIALNNALFLPRLQVNYQNTPWAILSHPTLAQVGVTENQAKRQFSQQEVIVLRHYYKSIAAAQLKNEITGICKLVVLGNGKILGATIFSTQARELINLIALAMSRNISVKHLGNLSAVYPSFSELLEQTARDFSQHRFNNNTAWQDWLENLFYLRRNWNL